MFHPGIGDLSGQRSDSRVEPVKPDFRPQKGTKIQTVGSRGMNRTAGAQRGLNTLGGVATLGRPSNMDVKSVFSWLP